MPIDIHTNPKIQRDLEKTRVHFSLIARQVIVDKIRLAHPHAQTTPYPRTPR